MPKTLTQGYFTLQHYICPLNPYLTVFAEAHSYILLWRVYKSLCMSIFRGLFCLMMSIMQPINHSHFSTSFHYIICVVIVGSAAAAKHLFTAGQKTSRRLGPPLKEPRPEISRSNSTSHSPVSRQSARGGGGLETVVREAGSQ